MSDMQDRPFISVPGDAERLVIGGFDVVFHATGETTGGAFTLLETSEQQEGMGPPMHIHHDAAETFIVLEGAYVMHVGDESRLCPPGSTIHVPRGVPHTFASAEPACRKLNLFTPAAMEGYFVDLASAIEQGVDERGMEAIANRYAMEVVGPAPKGYLESR